MSRLKFRLWIAVLVHFASTKPIYFGWFIFDSASIKYHELFMLWIGANIVTAHGTTMFAGATEWIQYVRCVRMTMASSEVFTLIILICAVCGRHWNCKRCNLQSKIITMRFPPCQVLVNMANKGCRRFFNSYLPPGGSRDKRWTRAHLKL